MGQSQGRNIVNYFSPESSPEYEMTDYGENTGLFLKDIYVPPEVLSLILSFVDNKTLIKSTRVCKLWNEIIKEHVWKIKAERKFYRKLRKFPNLTYQMMCIKDPFNKNLIKNPCGAKKFDHWHLLQNMGHKFLVEDIPVNCDPVPDDVKSIHGSESCFATSFGQCMKRQTINLVASGLVETFLDEVQPPIYVADWYGSRRDCACAYGLDVVLLDAGKKETEHVFRVEKEVDQWQGATWNKVEHTFTNYGRGIRFVQFTHVGQDKQFWAGHYGSKMTGSTVKILDTF